MIKIPSRRMPTASSTMSPSLPGRPAPRSGSAISPSPGRPPSPIGSVTFDLSDPAACTAAITSIAEQTGRIDVLINNAGINRRGPLLELDPTDWSLSYAVNVDALFHLCRAALPIMIAAGGGSRPQRSNAR
jgi:NAD(P)-dependent dehydrogenase (short-subunit alcohol dehydrogenase family)